MRELRRQVALDPRELALALLDVRREADRPRRVGEAALDALPDPQRRVRRELEALAPVELLRGADQPEGALLDEVAQRQPEALVATRLRDDEAQVRVDHAVLGIDVAALDALGELDLLGGGQQLVARRLVEERLQRVGGHLRLGTGRLARGLLGGCPALGALRWGAVFASAARARCRCPSHAIPFRCVGAPCSRPTPTRLLVARPEAARQKTGEEAVERVGGAPTRRRKESYQMIARATNPARYPLPVRRLPAFRRPAHVRGDRPLRRDRNGRRRSIAAPALV